MAVMPEAYVATYENVGLAAQVSVKDAYVATYENVGLVAQVSTKEAYAVLYDHVVGVMFNDFAVFVTNGLDPFPTRSSPE